MPTTLQHVSRLDSKTFLTEFIQWTIFPTYGGLFSVFLIFGWTIFPWTFFPWTLFPWTFFPRFANTLYCTM